MPEKPEQTPYEPCLLAAEKLLAPLVKRMASGEVALLHGGRAKKQSQGNYRVWNYENETRGKAAHLYTWAFDSADDFLIANTEGELTYQKRDFGVFPHTRAKGNSTEQVFPAGAVSDGTGLGRPSGFAQARWQPDCCDR